MNKLTKNNVLAVIYDCRSESELSKKLNWDGTLNELRKSLEDLVPGYQSILCMNQTKHVLENSTNEEVIRQARLDLTRFEDQILLNNLARRGGIGNGVPGEVDATRGTDVHKVAEKDSTECKVKVPTTLRGQAASEWETLSAVANQDLDGVVFHNHVRDTLRTYLGRRLCVVHLKKGLFGGETTVKGACFEEDAYKYYTLTDGFMNQCDITRNAKPTPYWCVMQAMIELKQWVKKIEVVEHAVGIAGEEARKACSTAYDVLKTHCFHPCKSNAGMGFMVDEDRDANGVKEFVLRSREAHETVEYLIKQRNRVAEAVDNHDLPIATHIVSNPH